jgi:hypothetical protein
MESLAISASTRLSSTLKVESTLFFGDFGESGSFLDEFSVSPLIVLLVFEQFADLEAGEFATDVVLDLD